MAEPAGSAGLVLVESAALLHPGETILEAMLVGWRRQHAARRLSPTIAFQRQRTVRRFAEFTGAWPWEWRAEHLDAWVAQGRWAHSTVRSYQGSIAVFSYGTACQGPGKSFRALVVGRAGTVRSQRLIDAEQATGPWVKVERPQRSEDERP